jgi:hypothetical protein
MAQGGRGLRLVDLLAILFLAAIVGGMFMPTLGGPGRDAVKARCRSNLRQIGVAMAMYFNTRGQNAFYAVPAKAFRGDAWLASMYWSGMITDPRIFRCPGTDDAGVIPPIRFEAGDLSSADAIPADAISYAGRCRGTALTHRNSSVFTEAGLSVASILACDDNEGSQNHTDGILAVYFDTHVDFFPDADPATIGAPGSEFKHLDSGE